MTVLQILNVESPRLLGTPKQAEYFFPMMVTTSLEGTNFGAVTVLNKIATNLNHNLYLNR